MGDGGGFDSVPSVELGQDVGDVVPHFERSRAAVTEALDHDQLERAWSAGQRMPLVSWKRHWAMQVE
jgi:hypothetical protein